MSFSLEALAMAGVDYNEWGMDLEEWERMEMGPPPPHLYADDYEEQEHNHERDEEVIMITATNATHELCGSKEPKNQFPDYAPWSWYQTIKDDDSCNDGD
ncbi:hypothetical protein E3N88_01586 [Mikania micrantha]|uniref:Uncharacterized protein n=1 Tax=Mikania micrantha TaxID=192012 RepID=A0A5N6Q440_9ASTR|nr:hypothetical protein E3N88_01586 [Mikania micrantha]